MICLESKYINEFKWINNPCLKYYQIIDFISFELDFKIKLLRLFAGRLKLKILIKILNLLTEICVLALDRNSNYFLRVFLMMISIWLNNADLLDLWLTRFIKMHWGSYYVLNTFIQNTLLHLVFSAFKVCFFFFIF